MSDPRDPVHDDRPAWPIHGERAPLPTSDPQAFWYVYRGHQYGPEKKKVVRPDWPEDGGYWFYGSDGFWHGPEKRLAVEQAPGPATAVEPQPSVPQQEAESLPPLDITTDDQVNFFKAGNSVVGAAQCRERQLLASLRTLAERDKTIAEKQRMIELLMKDSEAEEKESALLHDELPRLRCPRHIHSHAAEDHSTGEQVMSKGLKRAVAEATRKPKDGGYIQLYKAVAKYVEAHGGKVIATGGIQLQQWPDDTEHTFYVAVKCTGSKPVFEGK